MEYWLKKYLLNYDSRLTVYHCEHNGNYEQHSHRDFYELVLVRSGKAEHVLENNRQKLSGGDIFLIPPGVEHSYADAEKFEIYNLLFGKSFFRYFESDLQKSLNYHLLFPLRTDKDRSKNNFAPTIFSLSGNLFWEIEKLTNDIEQELNSSEIGARVGALSDFLKIVLIIIRHAKAKNNSKNGNKNMLDIGKLLAILDDKYMEKWSIASMAKFSGMQINNFRFKFKEQMGISPINYLMKLRIEKAIGLLQFSDMNISEIALAVGFEDSNYFSRQFSKYIGKSPRTFIKER